MLPGAAALVLRGLSQGGVGAEALAPGPWQADALLQRLTPVSCFLCLLEHTPVSRKGAHLRQSCTRDGALKSCERRRSLRAPCCIVEKRTKSQLHLCMLMCDVFLQVAESMQVQMHCQCLTGAEKS